MGDLQYQLDFLRKEHSRVLLEEERRKREYFGARNEMQEIWDKLVALRGRINGFEASIEEAKIEAIMSDVDNPATAMHLSALQHGTASLTVQSAARLADAHVLREKIQLKEGLKGRISLLQEQLAAARERLLLLTNTMKRVENEADGSTGTELVPLDTAIATALGKHDVAYNATESFLSPLQPSNAMKPSIKTSFELRNALITTSEVINAKEMEVMKVKAELQAVEVELAAALNNTTAVQSSTAILDDSRMKQYQSIMKHNIDAFHAYHQRHQYNTMLSKETLSRDKASNAHPGYVRQMQQFERVVDIPTAGAFNIFGQPHTLDTCTTDIIAHGPALSADLADALRFGINKLFNTNINVTGQISHATNAVNTATQSKNFATGIINRNTTGVYDRAVNYENNPQIPLALRSTLRAEAVEGGFSLHEVLNGEADIYRINGEPPTNFANRLIRRLGTLVALEAQVQGEFQGKLELVKNLRELLRDVEIKRLRIELQLSNIDKALTREKASTAESKGSPVTTTSPTFTSSSKASIRMMGTSHVESLYSANGNYGDSFVTEVDEQEQHQNSVFAHTFDRTSKYAKQIIREVLLQYMKKHPSRYGEALMELKKESIGRSFSSDIDSQVKDMSNAAAAAELGADSSDLGMRRIHQLLLLYMKEQGLDPKRNYASLIKAIKVQVLTELLRRDLNTSSPSKESTQQDTTSNQNDEQTSPNISPTKRLQFQQLETVSNSTVLMSSSSPEDQQHRIDDSDAKSQKHNKFNDLSQELSEEEVMKNSDANVADSSFLSNGSSNVSNTSSSQRDRSLIPRYVTNKKNGHHERNNGSMEVSLLSTVDGNTESSLSPTKGMVYAQECNKIPCSYRSGCSCNNCRQKGSGGNGKLSDSSNQQYNYDNDYSRDGHYQPHQGSSRKVKTVNKDKSPKHGQHLIEIQKGRHQSCLICSRLPAHLRPGSHRRMEKVKKKGSRIIKSSADEGGNDQLSNDPLHIGAKDEDESGFLCEHHEEELVQDVIRQSSSIDALSSTEELLGVSLIEIERKDERNESSLSRISSLSQDKDGDNRGQSPVVGSRHGSRSPSRVSSLSQDKEGSTREQSLGSKAGSHPPSRVSSFRSAPGEQAAAVETVGTPSPSRVSSFASNKSVSSNNLRAQTKSAMIQERNVTDESLNGGSGILSKSPSRTGSNVSFLDDEQGSKPLSRASSFRSTASESVEIVQPATDSDFEAPHPRQQLKKANSFSSSGRNSRNTSPSRLFLPKSTNEITAALSNAAEVEQAVNGVSKKPPIAPLTLPIKPVMGGSSPKNRSQSTSGGYSPANRHNISTQLEGIEEIPESPFERENKYDQLLKKIEMQQAEIDALKNQQNQANSNNSFSAADDDLQRHGLDNSGRSDLISSVESFSPERDRQYQQQEDRPFDSNSIMTGLSNSMDIHDPTPSIILQPRVRPKVRRNVASKHRDIENLDDMIEFLIDRIDRCGQKWMIAAEDEQLDPVSKVAVYSDGQSKAFVELSIVSAKNLPEMKRLTRRADAYVELYLAAHQQQDEPIIRINRSHSRDPQVNLVSEKPTAAFREASPLATGHIFELNAEAADTATRLTKDVTSLLLAMEKLTTGPTQTRNQLSLAKHHLVTGRVYERSKDPFLLNFLQQSNPQHPQHHSQGSYGKDNWNICFDSYCRTTVQANSLYPEWRETFRLPGVTNLSGNQSVWVVVRDSSTVGHQSNVQDEMIGQTLIPLNLQQLEDQHTHSIWLPLQASRIKKNTRHHKLPEDCAIKLEVRLCYSEQKYWHDLKLESEKLLDKLRSPYGTTVSSVEVKKIQRWMAKANKKTNHTSNQSNSNRSNGDGNAIVKTSSNISRTLDDQQQYHRNGHSDYNNRDRRIGAIDTLNRSDDDNDFDIPSTSSQQQLQPLQQGSKLNGAQDQVMHHHQPRAKHQEPQDQHHIRQHQQQPQQQQRPAPHQEDQHQQYVPQHQQQPQPQQQQQKSAPHQEDQHQQYVPQHQQQPQPQQQQQKSAPPQEDQHQQQPQQQDLLKQQDLATQQRQPHHGQVELQKDALVIDGVEEINDEYVDDDDEEQSPSKLSVKASPRIKPPLNAAAANCRKKYERNLGKPLRRSHSLRGSFKSEHDLLDAAELQRISSSSNLSPNRSESKEPVKVSAPAVQQLTPVTVHQLVTPLNKKPVQESKPKPPPSRRTGPSVVNSNDIARTGNDEKAIEEKKIDLSIFRRPAVASRNKEEVHAAIQKPKTYAFGSYEERNIL